jgi:ATP-binding cassette subfamily B protein
LFWLASIRIGRRIREASRKQRQREGAMATIASEVLGAISAVKSLSLEDKFTQEFSRKNNQSQKEDLKASRLSLRLARIVDILLAIATAAVMWYGANLVLENQLRVGDLVVFLIYLKRSFKPAQEFAKYTARMAKATASGERVIALLAEEPEIQREPGSVSAEGVKGKIEFERVSFGYKSGQPVLQDFDLTIQPGQTVCIVGPSGAGKSTVLSLLLRLYRTCSGTIKIDGRDIREYSLESLRSQMSVVLQSPLLFAASIRENIAVGNPSATDQDIIKAAQLAGVDEFANRLGEQYEAPIGELGRTLSRGQCQRVAMARAAVRKAPILLLDEPTTGLDQHNEQAVSRSLLDIARGTTTLMVTHNLALAAQADLVVYLADGSVVQQGTHAELMKQPGPYQSAFQSRRKAEVKLEEIEAELALQKT